MADSLVYDNAQDLFNAIVAQAVNDYARMLVQEIVCPADENGEPPEEMLKSIKQSSYMSAATKKFPIKRARKTFNNAYEYAEHLYNQSASSYIRKWHDIFKDGQQALTFLNDEERIARFTSLTGGALIKAAETKRDYILEDIEKGYVPPRPPYMSPKSTGRRRYT